RESAAAGAADRHLAAHAFSPLAEADEAEALVQRLGAHTVILDAQPDAAAGSKRKLDLEPRGVRVASHIGERLLRRAIESDFDGLGQRARGSPPPHRRADPAG